MGEWIPIRWQRDVVPAGDDAAAGSISPYDIPEAIRAARDGDMLTLEFRYATEEPLSSHQQGRVCLWTGRNSGRLYKVSIDAKGIHSFKLVFSEAGVAIDALRERRVFEKRSGNYGVARNVISAEEFSKPLADSLAMQQA